MDIQTLLDHYTKLARVPGFKAYAWQRVQELAKEPEWCELPALLVEAMRNEQIQKSENNH